MGTMNSLPLIKNCVKEYYKLKKRRIINKFYRLCRYGSAEELYNYTVMNNIPINKLNINAIVTACMCGNINVAKMLIQNLDNINEIHNNSNVLINCLFNNSTIEIIQWFLSLGKIENFKLRQYNDQLFRNICSDNKINSAKLLETLYVNYRIEIGQVNNNDQIINYYIFDDNLNNTQICNTLKIKYGIGHDVLNDECPICFENNEIVLSCNHTLCVSCFYNWYIKLRKPSRCQICTNSFYYKNCYYI